MADPLFEHGYYAATAHAMPDMVPLTGDAACDLCVVGAGWTGLSAALRAAEHGLKVIVLEAALPGHGASGRNGGQLIPGLRWDARMLLARLGEERGRALFELAVSARDRVQNRIRRHGIDCDLKTGHIQLAWKPSHYRDFEAEAECLDRLGYAGHRLVPRRDIGEHVASDRYHGGLYDVLGGHFHPLNHAIGMAHAAVAAGAIIHPLSAVTTIDRRADGVVLTTAKGRVSAREVVLAADTGMASVNRQLARHAMPIMNYNIATEPLGETRAAGLMPSDAAASDSRFVLNYFRLSADRRLIFGGGEKYTHAPPADIVGFVRRHMLTVFPQLGDVAISHHWGGAVGVSRSRLPHIGREDGLWFAHGFSGHGALLTTLAGELIADRIAGQNGSDLDQFATLAARPFPGGAMLRAPLHILGMLWYALRDRL